MKKPGWWKKNTKTVDDSVHQGSKYLEVHEGLRYLEVEQDEKVLNSSSNDDNNSWCVSTIEEFLYYCCPDCDVKIRDQETFVRHALSAHPVSANYLGQLIVKEEFIVDKNDTNPEGFLADENIIGKNEESNDYMDDGENYEYSSNFDDPLDSYYSTEEPESLTPKKVNAYCSGLVIVLGTRNLGF